MDKKEIENKLKKGHIHLNVMFEVVGHPKEHVENALKSYIANIKQDQTVNFLNENYEPAEEIEKGIFSAFAETELLVEDLNKVTWLAINFTPASIEFIEPEKITLNDKELTDFMNDLLAKLHEIGTIQKASNSEKVGILKSFNAMSRNAILLAMEKNKTVKDISKKVGLQEEHTIKFLEAMIQEKTVEKKGDEYFILPKSKK